MEHPIIKKIRSTGYPELENEPIGTDFFGNEFFDGEELYVFEDEVFVSEELSSDAKEILDYFGAIKK